jgi:hypothetical protein
MGVPRRDFIRAVSGAAVATTASSYSRILGAADRVRLGVIGCGGRGVGAMLEYPAPFTATFEATLAPGIKGEAIEFYGTEGRLWISRKTPNGDVLIGHRSAQASRLGNIAYLEKRRIQFDPTREQMLPS